MMRRQESEADIVNELLAMQQEIDRGTRCSSCGRPRATNGDIDYWLSEFGMDYRGPEPTWSRDETGEQVLCWSKTTDRCGNRLSRHLRQLLARSEFSDYCEERGL